ncbi:flavin-containing monooxygenase [Nocardioides mesophilus]|uniref:NAD(P)/FAD-dependent oxidoreductase n=1 Tax=Nocardioides mesophilus TaxID=433659 RepID=A0A7G9RA01_9ACTN|nr:NAD(P)/FAD-dependent oxidoreductase [Nocardioides mesophilus]QNN52426.1 NAD(P)/FAD-dependent oxidoreductase [Nocardioides mesophilus]
MSTTAPPSPPVTSATPAAAGPAALPRHVRVLVVGAGFGGLGMAIRLQQQGERDFAVLDKGEEVGGTWRDNTYPGAACDVPSQLYSFSFAPNPDWSRSFSPQAEIQAYLRRVARESGVLDRFFFGTSLERASWDDEAARWRVVTSAGELSADVLVTATGGLSEPRMPAIDGVDEFERTIFHSARWDHEQDLAGKRVAVIGTGASAIQIVPELARTVAHLDVYQRTAPWVIPRRDRAYSSLERLALRHLPPLRRAYRTAIYWARECYVPGFTIDPRLAAPAERAARANIARAIHDPGLQAAVTPTYRLGCKRVLLSNDYYPALAQDHVALVTDPIRRISRTGVVSADGTERPVDAIVVATGFHTTEQPIAARIRGREGRSLAEVWAGEGMNAYKGTTVHGFPNLFQIVGPNTGLGHSSMVFVIESQIAYVLDALATMRRRGLASVQPTAAAQHRWNAALQRRMKRTVWSTGGCSSWYLDAHGRNTTLWPRTTFVFRRLLSSFDVERYVTTPAGPGPEHGQDPTGSSPTTAKVRA